MTPPLPVEPVGLERRGLPVSLLVMLLLGLLVGFTVVAGCTTVWGWKRFGAV